MPSAEAFARQPESRTHGKVKAKGPPVSLLSCLRGDPEADCTQSATEPASTQPTVGVTFILHFNEYLTDAQARGTFVSTQVRSA